MEKEEYLKKRKEIIHQHWNDLRELCKKMAFDNNTIKVGDIVTDRIGSIKVERVQFQFIRESETVPYCVYTGQVLKKDLTPTVKKQERSIHQPNLTRQ